MAVKVDNSSETSPSKGEIILYSTASGDIRVEVFFQDETLWLTQKQIAELFDVDVRTVSEHLQRVFSSKELQENSVIRKFRNTATDGKSYLTNFYHLDAIIAVGYRVNSLRATQFRIWATQTLREFIIKGFVLDDERLKLNKLHWAITGQTAAEIVASRAKASLPNMGLTTWKNAPHGKILKSDVVVAKNYLNEKEIKELERIVTMYLDYADLQAERQIPMRMQDWVEKLDAFLKFNEYDILHDPGKVSHEVAAHLAQDEYERFRVEQDHNFESDFEKETKRLMGKKKQ